MSFSFNNKETFSPSAGTARGGQVDMFRVTGGGTTFSGIIHAGTNNLIQAGMVVNDGLYLGQSTSGYQSKFAGVEFNIGTALVATGLTLVWEYIRSDNTWATLTVTDGTAGFTNTGVNSVTWTPPDDWGSPTNTINSRPGVAWVRCRISAVTTITTTATQAATQLYFYDYSLRFDDNEEYDSGTATSSGTTSGSGGTITDTSKSWTTDALKERYVYIHTGTGAGQMRVIRRNTVTILYTWLPWTTLPDTTSQYSITSTLEDLYNADVAAGWGMIEKTARQSYYIKCNLTWMLCSYSSVNETVQFKEGYNYHLRPSSSTTRYRQIFGMRLTPEYGAASTTLGSSWFTIQDSFTDNRKKFHTGDYVFLYGSNFINRYYTINATGSNLRFWFYNRVNESINNRFTGWRSAEYGVTTCESKNDEITQCHSGLESPIASFEGAKTYYSNTHNCFITGSSTHIFDNSFIGPPENAGTGSPFQEFGYTGTASKFVDNQGPRFRPSIDIWASGSTGILSVNYTLNLSIRDKANYLNNGRCVVKNNLGTVVYDRMSGETLLSNQAVVGSNSYTLTSQPSVVDHLRFNTSSFSDTSTTVIAQIIVTGTDKRGKPSGEIMYLENIGDGEQWTKNAYATVTGFTVYGFSATINVDRAGSFGEMELQTELWKSTDDTTLTDLVDYNPFTITTSRPGYREETQVIDIFDRTDLRMVLTREDLKVR